MKNVTSNLHVFVIGTKLLTCNFFKITRLGTTIRLDGPGNITISEPPMTEDVALSFEYEDRFLEFFNELKNRIIINIMNDPSRSYSINAWLALKDMNINLKRKLEEFSVNDLERTMVEIFFENKFLAYVPLSSIMDHVNSNFISTPDELMNFLREEIK